jgi:hypothetical protein
MFKSTRVDILSSWSSACICIAIHRDKADSMEGMGPKVCLNSSMLMLFPIQVKLQRNSSQGEGCKDGSRLQGPGSTGQMNLVFCRLCSSGPPQPPRLCLALTCHEHCIAGAAGLPIHVIGEVSWGLRKETSVDILVLIPRWTGVIEGRTI